MRLVIHKLFKFESSYFFIFLINNRDKNKKIKKINSIKLPISWKISNTRH